MKERFLIFGVIFIAIINFCSCGGTCNGQSTEYKLVGYTDKFGTKGSFSGTFVFGFGNVDGSMSNEMFYNVLIQDNDGTVYPFTLKTGNVRFVYISNNIQPSIRITGQNYWTRSLSSIRKDYQQYPRYWTFTLYIPENSIRYSNTIDGE